MKYDTKTRIKIIKKIEMYANKKILKKTGLVDIQKLLKDNDGYELSHVQIRTYIKANNLR